jgi:hypothetical protein
MGTLRCGQERPREEQRCEKLSQFCLTPGLGLPDRLGTVSSFKDRSPCVNKKGMWTKATETNRSTSLRVTAGNQL